MAQFKLSVNPTFQQEISLPVVGSDPMVIKFTFKYFTRKELAAIFDKWAVQSQEYIAKITKISEESGSLTNVDWIEDEVDLQVKQLKDIVVGWSFDEELNDENLAKLCDLLPGAPDKIVSEYREAYTKTRDSK